MGSIVRPEIARCSAFSEAARFSNEEFCFPQTSADIFAAQSLWALPFPQTPSTVCPLSFSQIPLFSYFNYLFTSLELPSMKEFVLVTQNDFKKKSKMQWSSRFVCMVTKNQTCLSRVTCGCVTQIHLGLCRCVTLTGDSSSDSRLRYEMMRWA